MPVEGTALSGPEGSEGVLTKPPAAVSQRASGLVFENF